MTIDKRAIFTQLLCTMNFVESVVDKLRRHPKRIVFPEGTDPRILQAAERFVSLKAGIPILLGNRQAIHHAAEEHGVKLKHVMIIDPEKAWDLPTFCRNLEKLDRYRKMGITDSREIMLRPNYFAAMMLQYGQADALVGGASGYAGSLLRPLIQLIKPLPGVQCISSCLIMEFPHRDIGEDGVLFMADCGVIPSPSIDQLAQIAFMTGRLARQLSGIRPRVAMLSFSTKGSAVTPETQKVLAATALAKQLAESAFIEMDIDGELQADTAILSELAKVKAPDSVVAGRANVLVFPDLNSGNIASKLVHHLTGARTYSQILLGLSKPAADLSRSSSIDDIVAAAAIVGLQAVEYRKIYPIDIF